MRTLMLIVAFAILGLFLVSEGRAGTVNLGKHSPTEIMETCNGVSGSPIQNGNVYGCTNTCGDRGRAECQ
jgi:hypothetical protein